MVYVLVALQIVTLIAVAVFALRKSGAAPETVDPRLAQLLAADLPGQLTRLDAHFEALSQHLRGDLSQLRADSGSEAVRFREASAATGTALRSEVLHGISGLGIALKADLDAFRADNTSGAERLRLAVDAQLRIVSDKITNAASDAARRQADDREALHGALAELRSDQTAHQEKLRASVEGSLAKLNLDNSAKLEEMRVTVDEKLNSTLQSRMNEHFGLVTDQLAKVYTGLGEMTKLSAGVDDLSRIFTNVKLRGGVGEHVVLEMLLKDRLAPSQYIANARVKPNTQESVEFAVRFPTPNGEMLLPIDSKFPLDKFEALQKAYETGADATSLGKAFETAIRVESKKICDKYISPPTTTAFAILFLPTESLYAEVIRRDGLQIDIQKNCHVTIAGPSTLSAILTSFQMGFHMLQLQQKGDEVWKVLANAQKQFGNLGVLMTRMENQINTVQNTVQEVGRRTRIITKHLTDAHLDTTETALSAGPTAFDGLLPMLAASEEADV